MNVDFRPAKYSFSYRRVVEQVREIWTGVIGAMTHFKVEVEAINKQYNNKNNPNKTIFTKR